MRVLMIHNDYLKVGGERLSVGAEVDGLEAAGVAVERLDFDNDEMLKADPVGKVRILVGKSGQYERTAAAIDRLKPQLVHVQNLFPSAGGGVIDAIAAAGVPWIRTLRNYRRTCIAGTHHRNGGPCFSCSSARRALPGVAHACYQGSRSASAGAMLYSNVEFRAEMRHPPEALVVLSNFMQLSGVGSNVVPTFVKPNAVAANVFDGREFERSDILFAGRLEPEKGVRLVVDVAQRLPHRTVTVLGDGSLRAELDAASSRVHNLVVAGAQTPAVVSQRMAAASLVIAPAAWQEPFGRVAAEALAAGTPALVSNAGGLPEIVRPLDERLVVDSSAPDVWAVRAEEVLRSSSYLALRAAAVDRWRRTYSPDAVSSQLLGIYQAVLA